MLGGVAIYATNMVLKESAMSQLNAKFSCPPSPGNDLLVRSGLLLINVQSSMLTRVLVVVCALRVARPAKVTPREQTLRTHMSHLDELTLLKMIPRLNEPAPHAVFNSVAPM